MKSFKNMIFGLIAMSLFMFGFCFTSFAGSWRQENGSWRYIREDGSHPANEWMWIDGDVDGYAECYYFDGNGNCYINTTSPDGYSIDQNGAWTINGAVQRCISVKGNLGYYNKRTGLARYYNQQSGRIILSMYPDNVKFAVLTLDYPRRMVVTDGITGEATYTEKVFSIHFERFSENMRDGSQASWRAYENRNVTVVFIGGQPELSSAEGGQPLESVGFEGDNVKIYTN